jgi:PAS domain S-box-containing protein
MLGMFSTHWKSPHRPGARALALLDLLSQQAGEIIARSRAELEARRLSKLIALSYEPMFVWDDVHGITFWNEGAQQLYKFTPWEVLGKSSHSLLRTVFPEPIERIMQQLETSGTWVGELQHVTRSGQSVTVESRMQRIDLDVPSLLDVNRDITARKHNEQQIRLLMREINHRSKNMLAIVHAIARQTVATGPEDFLNRFAERLQALAASQDLLVKSEWRGVEIAELARSQLAHFHDLIGTRIELQGPHLAITASAAQPLGMALHELATNAGKYGALSNASGRVKIAWDLDHRDGQDAAFVMSWSEEAGPAVTPPTRQGFGATVIAAMAEASLGAKVDLDFTAAGLRWQLRCPAVEVLGGG